MIPSRLNYRGLPFIPSYGEVIRKEQTTLHTIILQPPSEPRLGEVDMDHPEEYTDFELPPFRSL
jgi:hypothetical protein